MKDAQRTRANAAARFEIGTGDVVVSYTDGTAYGTVENVSHKVWIRWGTRVPNIDGHKKRVGGYEPFQLKATGKDRPKWRLLPYDLAAKALS